MTDDTHAAIGQLSMKLLDAFEEQREAGAELIVDHVIIVVGFYGKDADDEDVKGVVFRSDDSRPWSNRGLLEMAADIAGQR